MAKSFFAFIIHRMCIEELLKSLERKHPRYIDLSLDRITHLLDALGNPHLSLPPVIHVAGTNGKGSTIAFLRSILEDAGLIVHVYTSPHLVRFNERIVVAGKEIDNNYLCQLLKVIDKATNTYPVTFFEATTALAFLAFSETPADVVLLETGLGGRLDATNVIPNPALTVITPISVDHKEYLGDTLEAIVREKFGIVKAGTPCVVGLPSSGNPPLEGCISEGKAKSYFCSGKDYVVEGDFYKSNAYTIPLNDLGLAGEHQKINASMAIACIENLNFNISKENIINGLANAKWKARMQQIAPDIWLDGGHNEDAGRVISEYIRKEWQDMPTILIMGMLKNKEIKGYLKYFKGLVECIYGVNIDSQAVEVTKLSLLLKVLEGETEETINKQYSMIKERVLPDLSGNIKCGNSLIGTDFYNQLDLELSEDDHYRINVFDWEDEFKEVFADGGFDAVIGNPPYVQLSKLESILANEKKYLIEKYKTSGGRLNTFIFFIHLGFNALKKDGYLSFIIPNTILTQQYYKETRHHMINNSQLSKIVVYPQMPFSGAVVENITFVLKNKKSNDYKIEVFEHTEEMLKETNNFTKKKVLNSEKYVFDIRNNPICNIIDEKNLPHLEDILNINQAIALKGDKTLSVKREYKEGYYKLLDGRHITKYNMNWGGNYLDYDVNKIHSCKRKDIFLKKEKLLLRRVSNSIICTYDDEQFFALNTLVVLTQKEEIFSIKYLLGIINSKLLNYYYSQKYKSLKKVFSEIQARSFGKIPIPKLSLSNPADKQNHDRMVKLVDNMLSLHKKLQDANTPQQKTVLERQIKATDNQINSLTYQLYNLTNDEINIVEGKDE